MRIWLFLLSKMICMQIIGYFSLKSGRMRPQTRFDNLWLLIFSEYFLPLFLSFVIIFGLLKGTNRSSFLFAEDTIFLILRFLWEISNASFIIFLISYLILFILLWFACIIIRNHTFYVSIVTTNSVNKFILILFFEGQSTFGLRIPSIHFFFHSAS